MRRLLGVVLYFLILLLRWKGLSLVSVFFCPISGSKKEFTYNFCLLSINLKLGFHSLFNNFNWPKNRCFFFNFKALPKSGCLLFLLVLVLICLAVKSVVTVVLEKPSHPPSPPTSL